jgi:hypothetical protein
MRLILIVQMYGAVRSGEDSIIVIWLRLLAMVIVILHSSYTPKPCNREYVSSIFHSHYEELRESIPSPLFS